MLENLFKLDQKKILNLKKKTSKFYKITKHASQTMNSKIVGNFLIVVYGTQKYC